MEVSTNEAKLISKKNNTNFVCDECHKRKEDNQADYIQFLKAQLQQLNVVVQQNTTGIKIFLLICLIPKKLTKMTMNLKIKIMKNLPRPTPHLAILIWCHMLI
jgi:predicted metal-binding protein